ncbi:MAG: GlsB/YeaQ/YmgE family stress response membrane protein [Acidobacteria bacterium]|nr:GlsB/YeaQ/YmgE family stress response membrane protein [Acidobacteriota bacterium]
MLYLLWIIIIGFVAGAIAKLIMPGKDPGGFLITIGLGVAGALLSTLIGKLIGWYKPGESAGFIGALIGAIILLVIYRLYKKKQPAA